MTKVINQDDLFYTSGAEIQQMKLANGKYAWVVVAFQEPSYFEGDEIELSHFHTTDPEELFKFLGYQPINSKTGEILDGFNPNDVYHIKDNLISLINEKYPKINMDEISFKEIRSDDILNPEIYY